MNFRPIHISISNNFVVVTVDWAMSIQQDEEEENETKTLIG